MAMVGVLNCKDIRRISKYALSSAAKKVCKVSISLLLLLWYILNVLNHQL